MQISACYFEKDDVYYASTKKVTPAGVMELVDVVDSKSTAGDSVPVRVRSPAPINPIVNDTFTLGFILCTGWTRTAGESLGSDPTAAGGGVKGGERVAAVDKIEDQRKPEDFVGHRNRTPGTIIPTAS